MSEVETHELSPEVLSGSPPANVDKLDALIEAANRAEELAGALVRLRRAACSMSLKGDWIAFRGKDPQGKPNVKIELTGAGADRIATMFGVSFTNWTNWKQEGADENGEYYYWWYRCDAELKGRKIQGVEGRAGTRDKFFGSAYGKMIPAHEINEGNIRTAARHNCMKEGVKLLLGLRRIDYEEAKAIGIDPAKIAGVDFKSAADDLKGKASPKTTGTATKGKGSKGKGSKASEGTWTENGRIAKVWDEDRGKWKIFHLELDTGFVCGGLSNFPAGQALKDQVQEFHKKATMVDLTVKPGKYGEPNLVSVAPAKTPGTSAGSEAEGGDDPNDALEPEE